MTAVVGRGRVMTKEEWMIRQWGSVEAAERECEEMHREIKPCDCDYEGCRGWCVERTAEWERLENERFEREFPHWNA